MNSTSFDFGNVLNKLRSIEENAVEPTAAVDKSNYNQVISRLNLLKSVVPTDQFTLIKSGIHAMSADRRPNIEQLNALMNFLEVVLKYAAEDNMLFQRLRKDMMGEPSTDQQPVFPGMTDSGPQLAADEQPAAPVQAKLRDLK